MTAPKRQREKSLGLWIPSDLWSGFSGSINYKVRIKFLCSFFCGKGQKVIEFSKTSLISKRIRTIDLGGCCAPFCGVLGGSVGQEVD